MTDTARNEAMKTAGELVDRAVRAVVAPGDLVERRVRAESLASWTEPTPLAGLRAALAVIALAERRAHDFAVKLRGDGGTWKEIADLMGVPYDDRYSRLERTFEMVAGPPQGGGMYDQPSVYWRCGGPLGCDQLVIDRGPYEMYPSDNERGHAEGCRRLAAEDEAARVAAEERDRQYQVMEEAMAQLTDPFDRSTVDRCREVLRRGGEIGGKWSHGEQLAVALVLNDEAFLSAAGSNRRAAILRVYNTTPDRVRKRLATMRAAATGEPA